MFKIGLDVHGVIDHMPVQLKRLSQTVLKTGGEVHIITGGDMARTKKQLEKFGFPYSHFFSVQKFLNETCFEENIGLNLIDGKYLYPDDLWNKTKAFYCKKHNIDLHIDDSVEYKDHFETPFVFFERKKFNNL